MAQKDRLRQLIAREAARLMSEEGMREYRDAKRKAARRFGPEKALSLGSHLPSTTEIHGELQKLIGLYEEEVLPEWLLDLRLKALRLLELLEPFHPHLVGSVLRGVVTARSDIDIHLFAPSCEELEEFLRGEGIPFAAEVVTIRHGGEIVDYHHIYLDEDGVEVECTVYPLEEIHRLPRSSITGKPMERANAKRLKRIIEGMLGR